MTRTLDDVRAYLREQGFRSTDARRKILDAVFGGSGHFTADELLDSLRSRGERVSRASVYRTLGLLVEGGFVETREFQRGQTMFEAVLGRHHHDHIICTSCGRIVEFENEEIEALQDAVARQHGFRLDHHSLRLFGRCEVCARSGSGQRGRRAGPARP